jgi:bacillithiol biosynthesis deacetylase BshB1
MNRTRKALIVAPHPDDAELAMGGTIAKMLDAGWEVVIVDLTDGEPTPFGTKEKRRREAEQANRVLEITKRLCLDMPNRSLQATPENRRKLAEVIRLHTPDIIFAPAVPDYHPDHVAAAELAHAARFEAKLSKTDLPGGPHWTPKIDGYYSTQRQNYPAPAFVVDITLYWQKKLEAIRAYASQLQNSPGLVDKVETAAKYMGQCIGVKYGEPFASYETLKISDPDMLLDL